MGFVDINYVLCAALLTSVCIIVQADHIDFFSLERCGAGGLPLKLNSISQRLAYVFYDVSFECRGRIASWEFYATRLGVFYASVWRKDTKSTRYVMIGKNRIPVEIEGSQEVEIAVFDRIVVEQGDVLGLHYDFVQEERVSITSGIVAMETHVNLVTKGMKGTLGRTGTFNLMDSLLPVATSLPYSNNLNSLPALRAKIAGPASFLRLSGGPIPREGRAELFYEGSWGTACDRWFDMRGWPFLFCLELGYPDSVGAQYATEVGSNAIAPPNMPIHMHSPRCKPSQQVSMFSCDIHPYGKCSHTSDVYLTCEKKVKFVHSKSKHGGIPVHFEQGYWGSICDNRRPDEHEANRDRSWVTAFCLEMGYTGFKDIHNATEYLGSYVRQFPDVMQNPWCEGKNPITLSQCTSSPERRGCNSDTYYVICDR